MSLIESVAKWGGLGAFMAAPDRVWRAFTAGAIRRVRLEGNTGELPGYVARYLSEVATVLWRPTGTYFTERVFDRRIQANRDLAFERLQSVSTLYLYRHVPVLLSAHRQEQLQGGATTMFSEMAFPRGALNLDKLVSEAVDHYRATQEVVGVNQRFRIVNRNGRGFRQTLELSRPDDSARGGKAASVPYGFNRVIGGRYEDLGAPTAGPHRRLYDQPHRRGGPGIVSTRGQTTARGVASRPCRPVRGVQAPARGGTLRRGVACAAG